MKNTIRLAESASAEALHESWPKFAPGGDKKNGHWIALAVYTDGPKGPTASELRDALTKKLSGKTAEAKRGSTSFNSPLLPKLRGVYVRGAEIPGVSPNSMSENSDLLVYVVEFDTYMPKLFEIAEAVLDDLVLSKKDEYDRANGPVEGGYSALYSAAKAMRLDMDSVYSATDARQRRYMGEAVDPKLFGELRAVLQDPYEGEREGGSMSFLDSVWRTLNRIKKTVGIDEFEGEVLPYADGILGRVSPEYLMLAPAEFDFLSGMSEPKWTQDRIDFYMKHHKGFTTDRGGFSLEGESLEKALALNSSNIASHDGDRARFELYGDVLKSKGKLGSFFKWVSKGTQRIHVGGTEDYTPAAGVALVKNIMSALPSGLDLLMVLEFKEAPRNEALLADLAERLRGVTIKPKGNFALRAIFNASNLNRVEVLDDLVRDRVIVSYKKSAPAKGAWYSKDDGYILQF